MNLGAPTDRWLFVPLPVGEEEGWIMWTGHPAENKPDAHKDPGNQNRLSFEYS